MTATFAAVGVVVRDMAASVRFYRALGLDVPDPDGDHLEIVSGGFRLMLDAVEVIRSIDPDWEEPRGGPAIGLAFECESPADVDAMYRRVLEQGFRSKREPWDAFWGQRYAQVLDPDGNQVDLFARL